MGCFIGTECKICKKNGENVKFSGNGMAFFIHCSECNIENSLIELENYSYYERYININQITELLLLLEKSKYKILRSNNNFEEWYIYDTQNEYMLEYFKDDIYISMTNTLNIYDINRLVKLVKLSELFKMNSIEIPDTFTILTSNISAINLWKNRLYKTLKK
jgi:hypothetical protein